MNHPGAKICAVCGQAATVFVGFAAKGKVTAKAWCDVHAAEEGLSGAPGYDLLNAGAPLARRFAEPALRCPACDCSQRDFERKGRFGCAACYATFAGLLPPLLHRMHRSSEHRGKIPRRGADPAIVRHRLELLQTDLRNALRAERQEGSAQARAALEGVKAKLLAASLSHPGVTPPPAGPPATP